MARHAYSYRFIVKVVSQKSILTLFAISAALLLRNPGVSSYEVFGTMFKLTGSNFQFVLLGIVLIFSMLIKRPWCIYLCPLNPVRSHLTYIRGVIVDKWKNKKIYV